MNLLSYLLVLFIRWIDYYSSFIQFITWVIIIYIFIIDELLRHNYSLSLIWYWLSLVPFSDRKNDKISKQTTIFAMKNNLSEIKFSLNLFTVLMIMDSVGIHTRQIILKTYVVSQYHMLHQGGQDTQLMRHKYLHSTVWIIILNINIPKSCNLFYMIGYKI